VPALGDGRLSSVIPVYEAAPRRGTDSVPSLVPSPRATAVFGRDSLFTVYLEAYGTEPAPVQLVVRDDRGTAVWSDTARLPQRGAIASGTVALPVSRLGVGITTLVASHGTAGDTVRTPLFVGFGESLPVSSFEEMLSYLRYFATPEQLKALREAPPDRRAAAWAAFLRETDPVLSTPEHEGLRDYFARVEQANQRFREEGMPGWLTDRGMVFIALGEPDQVFEQGGTDLSQRGRAQIWEFSQYHAQLVFIDQTGFNRWRLTASSEAEFQAIARRKQRNQS
jgi:GWxTD domain-containing protein